MVYKHTAAEHVGPASFSDGNWHTVVVSSQNEKSMRLTIDGQEMWSNTDAGNRGHFFKAVGSGSGDDRSAENKRRTGLQRISGGEFLTLSLQVKR